MADSVVSSTVTFVLENLSLLLRDEANLLSGVEDQITSLSNELSFMNTFLNSEGKRSTDTVKQVVSQIRDVAHQAEDVIDTYIVNITEHRRRNLFEKCFHCKGHVVMLHEVNDQIKKIRDRINEINNNKAKYGNEKGDFKSGDQHNTVEEDAESLRRRRRDVEKDEVVGLLEESSDVIKHLMRDDSSLAIVSIIGMGGLGKTTLARKIYNMKEVKDMFPCRAWGYVSNDYRDKEFLTSLLQSMDESSTSEYKDWSAERLKEKVKECLKGDRYLVVIDDIWKPQVWDDEVKGLFPEEKNGSRILITSRLKNVASSTIVHYQLPFLNKEDSWKLFSKEVFRGTKRREEPEALGRTMVENCCKGLPLAIIALAELVDKMDKLERDWWSRIEETFHWQLTRQDNKRVMDILKLSYDNLHQTLKPCFLYLGIYSEGHEIPVRELIQLWIAEGFLQPKASGIPNSPEAEVAAEYYLRELVDQSLVQVASKKSDGSIKKCRIHSLLRNLCILESKANKFMEVCTELEMEKCISRRLSLHCKTQFSPTKYSRSPPRSLFLLGDKLEWDSKSKGWKWIRKSLKLARVVDLYPVTFVSAPSDLKTMIHLRYLKVKSIGFNNWK